MKKIFALASGDFRNITRETILVIVTFVPVFVGLLARFGLPVVRELLLGFFDLSEHYLFIMSFLILMAPMMYGTVIGFILLDERDEDILTFISVTPLAKSGYLAYRLVSPVIVSFVFSFAVLIIAGLVRLDYLRLVPVALMAAMEAPMITLFLGAFAANKVEGLAVAKGLGLMDFAPFVGYFVKSEWQLAAGVLPTYWVAKAFMEIYVQCGGYLFYTLFGLGVHSLYIYILVRRFTRSAA